MKYFHWRKGRSCGGDVQAIGEELDSLLSVDGTVTPARVVEHARDEQSAMHPCFEWDDGKAAHAFRLDQARSLVRSIVVVDPSVAEDAKPEPIVIHTRTVDHEPVYATPRLLRSDHDLLSSARALAESSVRQAQARVEELLRIERTEARERAVGLLAEASEALSE